MVWVQLTYKPTIDRLGSDLVEVGDVEAAYFENVRQGHVVDAPPLKEIKADLASHTKAELVDQAAAEGVQVDGKKDEIVDKLAKAKHDR